MRAEPTLWLGSTSHSLLRCPCGTRGLLDLLRSLQAWGIGIWCCGHICRNNPAVTPKKLTAGCPFLLLASLSMPAFEACPHPPSGKELYPSLSEKDAVASKFWQSVSTQERQLNVSVTLPRMFHTPCFSECHRKGLSGYPAWGILPPFPIIHDSTRLYLSGTFWSLPKPFSSYHTVLSPW